ncbi:MAG: MarR family winged helix-turn-helix transcriptional regulator [Oscillospiraceae bacterium]
MHHPFLQSSLLKEYESASAVFEAMSQMRKVWESYKPEGSLKRSDMAMIINVARLTDDGKNPVTISKLAKGIHHSVPGVSQKISFLEKTGYVTREADEADRRIVYVTLTPKGKTMSDNNLRSILGRMERTLGRIGPEKTAELISLIHPLRQAAEEVLKEEAQTKGENRP